MQNFCWEFSIYLQYFQVSSKTLRRTKSIWFCLTISQHSAQDSFSSSCIWWNDLQWLKKEKNNLVCHAYYLSFNTNFGSYYFYYILAFFFCFQKFKHVVCNFYLTLAWSYIEWEWLFARIELILKIILYKFKVCLKL